MRTTNVLRSAFLWSIVATIVYADAETDLITAALVEATRDADADVRLAAYRVLSEGPVSDDVTRTFRDALDDSNVDVQRVAIEGLVRIEGPTDDVISLLVARLNDEATSSVARENLVQIGEPAIPALLEAIKDQSKFKRRQVILALGRTSFGDHRPAVVEAVVGALHDDDKDVRLATIGTLERIRQRPPEGIDNRVLSFVTQFHKRADKNSDGVLTEGEWKSMRRNPILADTDRDGQITVEEFARWMSRRQK